MANYASNITMPNGTNVLLKDSECRSNLKSEIKRATEKETTLKNDIDDEMVRAMNAEEANTSLINKEVNGLNEKYNVLETSITTERDRAIAKENEILNKCNEWTTWKELGAFNGKGNITLPENWSECVVYSKIPNTPNIYYHCHFIRAFTRNTDLSICNVYPSENNGYYRISLHDATRTIYLQALYNQTDDYSENSTTYVYWR